MGARAWDRGLHQRLLSGDESALVEAHRCLRTDVLRSALRTTGDHQAAEDVAQAVWLDLWARPERYDPERASLKLWLTMRAKRAGVDWTRSQAAWRARDHRPEAHAPDAAEVAELHQGDVVMWQAVSDLPESERSSIRLAYFGDLTYRQVAVTLDLPEGTVKSRIKAGLARLRRNVRAPA